MKCFNSLAIAFLLLLCLSCRQNNEVVVGSEGIRFTSIPSSNSNFKFNNTITEDDSVNLIFNAYAYMGAGVGMGDFNNDGLIDVFMGANQSGSKLFINKGNLTFEDITPKCGIQTNGWVTGISVVDINNDGFDDIYISYSGLGDPSRRTNQLFINNQQLGFTDQAAAYGLNNQSYSSQAVFFDYDLDGDLDMYLLNHLLDHTKSNFIVQPNRTGNAPAQDKLFRNDGTSAGKTHPHFTDVSSAAGILEDGFGLGVAVSDFNNDGWPDLYIANDYVGNDILWMNNKNGTFSNQIASSLRHQSYSSMGVDAADINNDGLPDIMSLDMQPENNYRKKMMYSFMNYERFKMELNAGFQPQYMRNMLQLNQGNLPGSSLPAFSEIGQLAGISETDWSWSVLMADFDNDGLKDMHVTNGLGRDMINSDFINFYAATASQPGADFKTTYQQVLDKLASYGPVELRNYCFRNIGNYQFADVSATAGIGKNAISNGCAYADLDNDGDLDMIVNNINTEAFLLRNDTRTDTADKKHAYIGFTLQGDSLNRNGFGAKIFIHTSEGTQLLEQSPARGYLSTVDKKLITGVDSIAVIDSVKVIWPDAKEQVLFNLPANKIVSLNYKDALAPAEKKSIAPLKYFTDITAQFGLDFKHSDSLFDDYNVQSLLPQKYSQLGPFITEGDINGDGLRDFFIGGAIHQSGCFFIQQKDGSFKKSVLESAPKLQEDLGCLLFDADADNDLDLVVVSGSNEYAWNDKKYVPRLYKNDGKGNFTRDESAFPATLTTSAQVIAGNDIDGDGDIDLFIGGRVTPGKYPINPESCILENKDGKFTNKTKEIAPALQYAGMITAAIFTDLNNDKIADLVVAGEWMPIRLFINQSGKLVESTSSNGLINTNGFWRSLASADLDGDGDMDLIAGNLGQNNKYKITPQYPVTMYARDLDQNGSMDPLIFYYIKNETGTRTLFPSVNRDQFATQVPAVKKKFLYNDEFAKAELNNVYDKADLDNMQQLVCNEDRTVWLENKGAGKFELHALPPEAQFAPVNSILCSDVNKDGHTDLIIAGNEYQADVMTGQYDASYGLLLIGNGKGKFSVVGPAASGLWLSGDIKDLRLLPTGKGKSILLAAGNNEKLQAYQLK